MNEHLNRVGYPAQGVNRGPAEGPNQQSFGGKVKKARFGGKGLKIFSVILLGCVTVLILAVLVYVFAVGGAKPDLSPVKDNQYQAVFLNSADGQVYFGKLSQYNKDYYKLIDIYYVRVTTQPSDGTTTAQQNISLAKLGKEIHGPEDVMYIAKDKVMFWENLKEDGQVVTAIREYQKNGDTATPTPTADTTTPTVSPTKTQ